MQHIKYYLPGVSLILMAGFIAVFPEILVAFVSVLIMMLGVFALYTGHRFRKSEVELRRMEGRFQTYGRYRYFFYE
jgi:hypothetical protein